MEKQQIWKVLYVTHALTSKQAVILLVLQLMLSIMLSFQNMRKVACWKQMRWTAQKIAAYHLLCDLIISPPPYTSFLCLGDTGHQ